MQNGATAKNLPYTWDDYRAWQDDHRWEIIGGRAYAMTPAPLVRHQRIQREIGTRLAVHFRDRACEVLPAPIDVKLSETDIVQPDLIVVCRKEQIKRTHVEGGPTLIVEILSPTTEQRDRGIKMDLYAHAGVREVWLVSPWPHCIEVFVLDGSAYRRHGAFIETEALRSPTFSDLTIDLASVFDVPYEPGEAPPVVREPPGRYAAPSPTAE